MEEKKKPEWDVIKKSDGVDSGWFLNLFAMMVHSTEK